MVVSAPTYVITDFSYCQNFLSKPLTLYHYKSFNPFPNKPWFLRVCCTNLLKTLCEKEKLLVTSNFSFSHSVFYQFEELSSIFIQFEIVVCKLFLFGKSLKFAVWERVKNTVGRGEIARNE